MFWRKRKSSDFRAEIEAHLNLETERWKEQGLSEEEARLAARRSFGNVTRAEERFYESGRWLWWDHLVQDLRFGLRVLHKSPGFTAVAVISLALGIGVNTTFFSMVDGFFLRPLPIKDARHLVMIRSAPFGPSSFADYQDICRQAAVFKGIVAISRHVAFLTVDDIAEMLRVDDVSENFFSVLEVSPVLGHTFEIESARKDSTAVISYGLWQRRFGGKADALGKAVKFDGRNVTIVGVAPQWFRGLQKGDTTDVYFPADRWVWKDELAQRDNRDYDLIARLRPGDTMAQARAEFATIARPAFRVLPSDRQRIESRAHVGSRAVSRSVPTERRAAGGGGFSSGDLLCERGGYGPCEGGGPPTGIGHAQSTGRGPRQASASTAYGESGSCSNRRRGRPGLDQMAGLTSARVDTAKSFPHSLRFSG